LVLPSRAVRAVGGVGINVNELFAGRAILTELGTLGTDCSIAACHTIITIVMKFYFIGIVSIECVGGTTFALFISKYILVVTGAAHGTRCVRDVLIPKGTKLTGNMFRLVTAVVLDVFSNFTKLASNVDVQVFLVLKVTGGANSAVQLCCFLFVEEISSRRTNTARAIQFIVFERRISTGRASFTGGRLVEWIEKW